MSEHRLSAAQKRHLREMVGPDGETLHWRPANQGERACAAKLLGLGLLGGSFVTFSDGYYLSARGLEVARSHGSFAALASCSEKPMRDSRDARPAPPANAPFLIKRGLSNSGRKVHAFTGTIPAIAACGAEVDMAWPISHGRRENPYEFDPADEDACKRCVQALERGAA